MLKRRIPTKINICIALASYTVAIFSLYQAAASESYLVKFLWAIPFGLVGNTLFSLLHESVHGVFAKNRKVNDWFGRVSAAFFPTSFTMQQIFHLGHHKRNRTDAEMFDQYYKTDNVWMKRFIVYTLLTGFYWPSSPMANIIFLCCPWIFKSKSFRKNDLMKKTSFDDMLIGLDQTHAPHFKMRLEILFSIAIQASLIFFLGINLVTWFICYWTFAIFWSSLQYTDHAWTVRNIREGAWNLKVSKLTHMIWLNYHYHLCHHRHPNYSWLDLPKLVKPEDKSPSFWSIYFKLWRGPTLATSPSPKKDKELEEIIYNDTSIGDFLQSQKSAS